MPKIIGIDTIETKAEGNDKNAEYGQNQSCSGGGKNGYFHVWLIIINNGNLPALF